MGRRDQRRKRSKWLRAKELPTTIGEYELDELIGKVIRFGEREHPERPELIGIVTKYKVSRVILQSKYVRKGLPKTFYCAYLSITVAKGFLADRLSRNCVFPLYPIMDGVYIDEWDMGANILIKEIYDEFEQIIKKLEYDF